MATDRTTFNLDQCGRKPCIRGMRIRVTDVLELLASGLSIEEIITDELPDLEYEDVIASLDYAVTKLNHPVFKEIYRNVAAPRFLERRELTSGGYRARTLQ